MPVTIPAEGVYTDLERNWIGWEPPGLFPPDQDTFWGQMRKVFCDYMQDNLYDQLVHFWNAMSPTTCAVDELHNWEIELGIPVDESKDPGIRRAFIESRLQRGAFTRTRRRQVIEAFILATEGTPITFRALGIPFTTDGLIFYSGTFDPTTVYEVVEDIPNFTYDVRILDTVDVDQVGLYRELYRITPSPIDANFSITMVSSL